MKHLFYFPIILWGLCACSPVHSYLKKGDACYQQMDYDQAATFYFNILLLDSNHSVAKEALSKTGNLVLISKFSRFGRLISENRNQEAIQQYLNNKRYFEKVKSVHVYLNWPTMYDGLFEDAKFDFVNQTIDELKLSIHQHKYDKAELLMEQVAAFEPVFVNATVTRLATCSDAFAKYAQQLLHQGKSYKAYQIIKKSETFLLSSNLSKTLLAAVLQSLTKRMVVLPIEEQIKSANFAELFSQKMQIELASIQPDIIQLIPANQIERVLADSMRRSNQIEPISKILLKNGIQLFLQIAVNEYKETSVNPSQPDSLIGYLAFIQKSQVNEKPLPVSVIRFKPVKYGSLKKLNQIEARITYRLVDCKSQLTIVENTISLNQSDSFHSYFYNGDLNQLYERLPQNNQIPERNPLFYEQFNLVAKSITELKVIRQELADMFVKRSLEDLAIYLKQD